MAAATSRREAFFYQNPTYFQINIANSNIGCHFELKQSQDSRSPSDHSIIALTITGFLGLLQIQTVGNALSSFEVHPIISMASVFSLLGYYASYRAKSRFPNYARQLAILIAVFGSFSVSSLLSLLLPDSWWHVKLSIFIVLLCELFYGKIKLLFDKYVLKLFWGRPPRRNITTPRQLLPLTYVDSTSHATTAPYRRVRSGGFLRINNVLASSLE